jgi:hypothetical protein
MYDSDGISEIIDDEFYTWCCSKTFQFFAFMRKCARKVESLHLHTYYVKWPYIEVFFIRFHTFIDTSLDEFFSPPQKNVKRKAVRRDMQAFSPLLSE